MGFSDLPPSHVPPYVQPLSNGLLQVGGILWTACYILSVRDSLRDKTYGMPLGVVAMNFAWYIMNLSPCLLAIHDSVHDLSVDEADIDLIFTRELIYGLYVAEAIPERIVINLWLIIDIGLLYLIFKYGPKEFSASPLISKNLPLIFCSLVLYLTCGQYAFASWWIRNNISSSSTAGRKGVYYGGKEYGPDTSELGFWTSSTAQLYLSGACLAQLLTRGSSRGTSWAVWGTRTAGSVLGLYSNYWVRWWGWREANGYVGTRPAVWLCLGSFTLDCAYGCFLWYIKQKEAVAKLKRQR